MSRDPSTKKLVLEPKSHFVFGGDSVDWGSGDLRFVSELVSLHETYPGRVHIVLGNRDINKLRLLQELRPGHLKSTSLKTLKQPYWTKKISQGKTPYEQYMEAFHMSDDQEEEQKINHSIVSRLRWILRFTMGAPQAFELRKTELCLVKHQKQGIVEDVEVAKSFLSEIKKGGSLRKLLEIGKLGVIIGNTLFVHGGVHKVNYGWLPNSNDVRCKNAAEWISKLNEFKSKQMKGWDVFESDVKDDDDHVATWSVRGGYTNRYGEDLLMYGMRMSPGGGKVNPGVVYADYIESDNSGPRSVHEDVVSFLNRSGIQRVVVGHRPHGDACLAIHQPGLSVLTMDTSYASMVRGVNVIKTDSRRGVAVHELLLMKSGEDNDENYDAMVHGILADGTRYEQDGKYHGMMDKKEGGWRVKGRCVTTGKILWSRMTQLDEEPWPVVENCYEDDVKGASEMKGASSERSRL